MMALTVKEAAAELGVSTKTIYWMCYQGEIPHNRIKARGSKGQGKLLISKDGLENWLKEGKNDNH